ncbi:MAG TPA: TonB-dependent receptor [Caulobacteraceae bacterium]|nr:TonB-dependent receptor [Caulobacteraceae bacterium]
MKLMTTRERLLASTMICGVMAIAVATPALAQTGTPPAPSSDKDNVVVVTGSRIPQSANVRSVSPVQTVNNTELKLSGATNVENLLNELPQVYTNQSEGASNGASGTATVNLRDLGPPRTLVLVDGTRMPPADVVAPAADLDQVPSALVQRVEVLTGGASSVYGSDAVAGVVNFIMMHDLEGVRIDAEYGFDNHHQQNPDNIDAELRRNHFAIPDDKTDGFTKDVTLAVGVNAPDGKGNIEVYTGYRTIDAVLEAARDFSSCSLITNNTTNTHICVGSGGTTPQGKFTRVDIPGQPNFHGTPTGLAPGSGPAFNFAPFNYLQRPDERYEAGYFAHYDFNDHISVYSSLMFSDNRTFAQIAPSGLFYGSAFLKVNCDNPYLVAAGGVADFCAGLPANGITTLFVGRRTVELGDRTDDLEHIAYRINLGVRGDINDVWSYDAYAQYGDTIYQERYTGEVSKIRFQNALLATSTTQCESSDPACVPINIFQSGALTPQMANYISGTGEKEGSAIEQILNASVTGDLGKYGLKTPWASTGVGVALGVDYVREQIDLSPDQEFVTGDLSGQGGQTPPVHGAYEVTEGYAELRVPIANHQPFADLLQLEAGYRYSDYSNIGGTNTYKIGGEWGPIPDIHFRASYNRAVRAPNTVELFSAPAFKLYGGQDPCSGPTPAASLAACTAQGVEANIGGGVGANGRTAYGFVLSCPAAQCTNLTSGNPHLGPETADTYTVGAVITPTFFRGFTASVDYFHIDVENLIGSYGAAQIMNECVNEYNTANGQFFCSFIHRDPVTNTIFTGTTITNLGNLQTMFGNGSINNFNTNTGFVKTSGLDINAAYNTRFKDWGMGDWGSIGFDFSGTYTFTFDVEPSPKIGHFDCSGFYGAVCSNSIINAEVGGPIPKWRHKFRVTWGTPWDNVSLSLQWRYISAVEPDFLSSNPILHQCPLSGYVGCVGNSIVDNVDKIPAFNYIDLALLWRVKNGVTLRAGVNNLFDKDPPLVDTSNIGLSSPPVGNANTFPGVYDSLGRVIFVGITADF